MNELYIHYYMRSVCIAYIQPVLLQLLKYTSTVIVYVARHQFAHPTPNRNDRAAMELRTTRRIHVESPHLAICYALFLFAYAIYFVNKKELTVSGVAVHYTLAYRYIFDYSSSRQPSRSVSLSVSFSTSVGNVRSLQLVSNVSIQIDKKKKTTFSNLNEKIITKFNTYTLLTLR